jgi:hypothetical protein
VSGVDIRDWASRLLLDISDLLQSKLEPGMVSPMAIHQETCLLVSLEIQIGVIQNIVVIRYAIGFVKTGANVFPRRNRFVHDDVQACC